MFYFSKCINKIQCEITCLHCAILIRIKSLIVIDTSSPTKVIISLHIRSM